jgi:hypothetical protein
LHCGHFILAMLYIFVPFPNIINQSYKLYQCIYVTYVTNVSKTDKKTSGKV